MIATYRVQLTPSFDFAAATAILPSLAALGVSHLYVSPILEARRGSTHGYDGVDPRRVRLELGGEEGFRALAREAARRGIGIVLDVVPNHLAASVEGEPFADVLARGLESPFASWFAIDWERAGGRIVLPWLSRPVADAIAAGEVAIERAGGEPRLRVGDVLLPLREDAAPRDSASLEATLATQHYSLVPWRLASAQRNVRRYLDLDELIGVRVEDAAVFAATHARILALAREGLVAGLRIDHLDGLEDPAAYLTRLRGGLDATIPIFVEAITAPAEVAVGGCGTTGYDFLAALTRASLDPRGEAVVEQAYRRLDPAFDPAVERRAALDHAANRLLRDETERAVAGLDPASREARLALPSCGATPPNAGLDAATRRWVAYVRAKGIEDTLFFRDARNLARCELGLEPCLAEAAVDEHHAARLAIAWEGRNLALNTTSTHDTKRSEDVRARLAAITFVAEPFVALVDAIREALAPARAIVPAELFYVTATVLASWPNRTAELPEFAARVAAHLRKAAREAKRASRWDAPNEAHEERLAALARDVIGLPRDSQLGRSFHALREDVASRGASLSLAWTLLKCLARGVPDVYQGCERFQFLLTDPDNRRPLDAGSLARSVAAGTDVDAALAASDLDAVKSRVLREGLAARRRLEDPVRAPLRAIEVAGTTRIAAFERVTGDVRFAVLARLDAPRLESPAANLDAATIRLPPGDWRDAFRGGVHSGIVSASALFARLPIALLEWTRHPAAS
jgi:(1->4)-alpha-D-glucan 1-alpha-D-glucosylmutase